MTIRVREYLERMPIPWLSVDRAETVENRPAPPRAHSARPAVPSLPRPAALAAPPNSRARLLTRARFVKLVKHQ